MRAALLFSALFFSITTLASTTIELVSGDYKITTKLTGQTDSTGATNIYAGCVEAITQTNGTCVGTYVLDLPNNKLEIKFTSGECDTCENESAVVTVTPAEFQTLISSDCTLELMFTSKMFHASLPAQVKVISTDLR